MTLSQSTYGSLEGDKFLEDEDNLNLSMYSTDDDETGTLLKCRTKSATSSAFERALNSASSKSDCPCLPSCCSPTDPYYSETKTSPFSHFLQKKSKTVSLLCLVVLGMSNVVPWLAFISCGDYFTFLFPTRNTGFIFPVLNMTLLTFGTILTTFYGRNLSLYVRLLLTNIIIIFLLLSVPLYIGPAYDKRELEEGTALTLTYAVLGLCSLCVAVNQSSCYGVAGVFGSEFICSLESGKGWSGLAIISIRMMLKFYFEKSGESQSEALKRSTSIFFYFGAAVVCLGVVAYGILIHTPFAIEKFEEYYSMPPPLAQTPNQTPQGTPTMGRRGSRVEASPNTKVKFSPSLSRPRSRSTTQKVRERMLSRIKLPAIGVFTSFTVCIACFPGIATSMKSEALGDWFPVLIVFCYNTFDLVGKALPAFWQPFDGNTVLLPVLMNVVILPLMILEKHYDDEPSGFFKLTSVRFATTCLLGLLTGFSATCCLMVAPGLVPERYREVAAQFMSVFLIFGLFSGSIVGAVIGSGGVLNDVPYPVLRPREED
ncbi:hypothetical protein TL16_g10009 [Triparma laevis f. inornata]|uniref:Uncharacterized protein n=1 Tax=Triparma laevis f. inornata TaxID=1714386 RepID=A0A9W7BDF8_9STRA|nr:hypothetical protein TL16_g10009 [Triparma laevis f. inornata]